MPIDELVERINARFAWSARNVDRKFILLLCDLVFFQIDQAILTSLAPPINSDVDPVVNGNVGFQPR